MPRRLRDEKGRLLKKDGTIDKRGETSKQNLKKSGLYQRVIKNKKVYESSDDDDSEEDEFDVIEVSKKKKVVEPEPEPEPVEDIKGKGVKEEKVNDIKVEPIEVKRPPTPEPIERPPTPEPMKPVKRSKKYKVVKSDSDSDSSDAEETEVVKKRKYKRKIKKYNDDLENLRREKKKLESKVLYNNHLNRLSQLSRDITLKF